MPKAQTSSRLVRLPEAADLLGVSIRQLRRAIADGRLQAVKLAGPTGPVHIERTELDRWVESSRTAVSA